jgi:hypothetical protein
VGPDYCALFEHEYGWPIGDAVLAETEATIAGCLGNLDRQSDFLASLTMGSNHWAEAPLSFRVNDVTVAATLDLVFLRPNGGITVVDWKIGRSDTSDYSRQLLVYALAVLRCGRWPQATAGTIELIEANLLKDAIHQHPVNQERLDDAEDFVYRSVMEMTALTGGDRFSELELDEYDVAARPTTCRYCKFGALCIERFEEAGRLVAAATVQGRLC